VIKFCCKNCGQNLSVPEIHAGKKGKCPKCKSIILVPQIQGVSPLTTQSKTSDQKAGLKDSPHSLTFLDFPQKDKTQTQPPVQYEVSDKLLEGGETFEGAAETDQTEPLPKRKLPWIIDIFLYPTNKAGLTMMGIIIGVPLLFGLIATLIFVFTLACSLFLITWPILSILGLIIGLAFGLYLYWYLCECVRDSAFGGIRAPETLGTTPGLGEMFWRVLNIVGCCVVFAGPSGFYLLYTHKADTIFWALLAFGVFIFPMGLLSVIMFDSFSGLNPILLIGSIISTFLPYIGLISLLAALIISIKFLLPVLSLISSGGNPVKFIGLSILYGSGIIDFYLMMVIAHLLGRFYWRYQDKLRWDV
jgi:phage FluMu protein Com